MDPILTSAIVIWAKSIIDTIRKDRSPGSLYVGKYDSHSTDSSDHTVTATQQVMAATLASRALFNGQCTPHEQYDSTEKKKVGTSSEIDTSPKTTTKRTYKKKSQEEADMKLIENVVERIKKELPDIIEKMHKTPPTVIPDSLDSIYISQITAAQEFINSRPLKSASLRDNVRQQSSADFFNKCQKSPHGSFEVVCGRSQKQVDSIPEHTFIKVAS